jgi:hypothetical protein
VEPGRADQDRTLTFSSTLYDYDLVAIADGNGPCGVEVVEQTTLNRLRSYVEQLSEEMTLFKDSDDFVKYTRINTLKIVFCLSSFVRLMLPY